MVTDPLHVLFDDFFGASAEDEVTVVLERSISVFGGCIKWEPLSSNDKNFGVIENQQSSAIGALIEKITNSIDAILMRKCYEAGIDPTSADAPATMDEAIQRFFGPESDSWHEHWNLSGFRNKQAEEIQILADGPRLDTSLVIYDNGEGQHPKDFEGQVRTKEGSCTELLRWIFFSP